MDLEKALRKEHSKKQSSRIAAYIGNRPDRFAVLMQAFLSREVLLAQRAGWVVSLCVEAHPELMRGCWPKLAGLMKRKPVHPAVTRNLFRLLQFVDIPKKYEGLVMTLSFQCLSSPWEAPAVRAFSMTVLDRLAGPYPEIRKEMELIIREQWDEATPAFRSRARKILQGAS